MLSAQWICGPLREIKVAVILSEAKDLHFRSEANQCRFFASLRMTDFRESEAKHLHLSPRQSSQCRFLAALGMIRRVDDSTLHRNAVCEVQT
jgi:hypothetical protein